MAFRLSVPALPSRVQPLTTARLATSHYMTKPASRLHSNSPLFLLTRQISHSIVAVLLDWALSRSMERLQIWNCMLLNLLRRGQTTWFPQPRSDCFKLHLLTVIRYTRAAFINSSPPLNGSCGLGADKNKHSQARQLNLKLKAGSCHSNQIAYACPSNLQFFLYRKCPRKCIKHKVTRFQDFLRNVFHPCNPVLLRGKHPCSITFSQIITTNTFAYRVLSQIIKKVCTPWFCTWNVLIAHTKGDYKILVTFWKFKTSHAQSIKTPYFILH